MHLVVTINRYSHMISWHKNMSKFWEEMSSNKAIIQFCPSAWQSTTYESFSLNDIMSVKSHSNSTYVTVCIHKYFISYTSNSMGLMTWDSIPGKSKKCFSSQKCPDGLWVHQASYSVGIWAPYPEVKQLGCVADHPPHLVQRFIITVPTVLLSHIS